MKGQFLKKLIYGAVCVALCQVLPLITGMIPEIGKTLLPMHLPVLLCGFVCGCGWGAAVGFLSPLMRSMIFGMPHLYPDAIVMAAELCAYGFFAGLLYRKLPKKPVFVYASLIASMLLGRAVWGAVKFAVLGIGGTDFPFSAFIAGGFTSAWIGIVIQIVLIPPIVLALKKANVICD